MIEIGSKELESVLNPVVSHTEGFSGVEVIATGDIYTVVFLDANGTDRYGVHLGHIKSSFMGTVIARLTRKTERYQEAMKADEALAPKAGKFDILLCQLESLASELSGERSEK